MGDPLRMRFPARSAPTPVAVGPTATAAPQAGFSTQAANALHLDPAQTAAILAERARPLRAWLDKNRARIAGLSAGAAAFELVRELPEAKALGRGTCEGVVRTWAADTGVLLPAVSTIPHPGDQTPPPPAPAHALADSDIVKAVVPAAKILSDGIFIGRAGGFTKVAVGGFTPLGPRGVQTPSLGATLTPGGVTLGGRNGAVTGSIGASWSGEVELKASVGQVNFDAKIGADAWSAAITFPSDTVPADLSQLGAVVGAAERASGAVIGALGDAPNLADIPDVASRVKPHTHELKAAVSALSSVAATPPGVSFGIVASGPAPGSKPGAPTVPAGSSVQAVLTVRF